MRKVKRSGVSGGPSPSMNTYVSTLLLALALASTALPSSAWADPKGGPHHCQHRGGGSQHGGGDHRADMSTIHALFADPKIKRTVKEIPGGVETLTEASTPEGAANIQRHVAAMQARIEELDPIHTRDPLFAELFAHAEDIIMTVENTTRGVKVRETSSEPYVTKLIRAHAAVVTKFIENGRREMHVDHAVPES